MLAYDYAADQDYHPELGSPWDIKKLYYTHGFIRRRFELIVERLQNDNVELSEEVLKHLDLWRSLPDVLQRVTTRVPVGPWFERRDDALRAHGTQIDPEGAFFLSDPELQREVWPTEEFELAKSRIGVEPTYSEPYEDDLFAGLEGDD